MEIAGLTAANLTGTPFVTEVPGAGTAAQNQTPGAAVQDRPHHFLARHRVNGKRVVHQKVTRVDVCHFPTSLRE
jgi:hypothetical protein